MPTTQDGVRAEDEASAEGERRLRGVIRVSRAMLYGPID